MLIWVSVYVAGMVLIVVGDGLQDVPSAVADVLVMAALWPFILAIYIVTAPLIALSALHWRLHKGTLAGWWDSL